MKYNDNTLVIKAGPKALALIRDEGLRPERIRVLAGAAGGPKWLVLYHLDRLLFSSFFKARTHPLHFIGSSIGAWRFAALSQPDPLDALDRFREAYIHQTYATAPTAAEVTAESRKVMDRYLPEETIPEILAHPWCRVNLLTVRCRHLTDREDKPGMAMGLAGAVASNLVGRRYLSYFFQRTLFHDPRNLPPLDNHDTIPFNRSSLNSRNFKDALLASGSIPLVMSGVSNIAGARPGIYRDGGMIDYHMDLPYRLPDNDMVLMPHYTDHIIPGWLDKKLPWRKPTAANMAHVVMIAPTKEFVQQLPNAKIPDRSDFKHYFQKDRERFTAWDKVVEMCRPPAEAFMELIESGRIRKEVQPIDFTT
jgi:Patatin-like phospholipase